MTSNELKLALNGRQKAFDVLAKEPNTLERNIVLAEHRTEIGRLEKLTAKARLIG